MTERSEALERIARLQERRGRTSSRADGGAAAGPGDEPVPPPSRSASPGRRRKPATTAKVVTVGASATAVLGLIALYGTVDRAAATPGPSSPAATGTDLPPVAPVPNSSGPAAPVTPQPDIVVLVVDDEGAIRSLDAPLAEAVGAAVRERAASSLADAPPAAPSPGGGQDSPAGVEAPSTAPVPVPVPVAVDLAVPAPSRPPAAAPAPAPAPAPVARSGGS